VPKVAVEGTVAAGFEEVRRVFEENFARRGECGASLCVWHEGAVVVDLWGGLRARKRKLAWERDTLATVFSTTKGLVALCFLMLADRGKFDYDAPVAEYWPEFGHGDKQDITVRTLLNHRSGLVGIDEPITLDMIENEPDEVARILAEQTTHWEPDTDQGYHGVTYGLYAAELFRRLTGETIGSFLAREVAGPLGADVYIGLPPELEDRVATNYSAGPREVAFGVIPKLLFDYKGTEGKVFRQVVAGKDTAKAFANPKELGPQGVRNFNSPRVHQMELPWGNGIGNARGLCRVYTALANGGSIDGVKLVERGSLEPVYERQSWTERDRVLRKPIGWSQGFVKEESDMFGPNRTSFGHPGAGGALGWCDPTARLAIGYALNKMDYRIRSLRTLALSKAIYRCLDG
jgi:CubicO group peptidase (beta-lactamase class C family)